MCHLNFRFVSSCLKDMRIEYWHYLHQGSIGAFPQVLLYLHFEVFCLSCWITLSVFRLYLVSQRFEEPVICLCHDPACLTRWCSNLELSWIEISTQYYLGIYTKRQHTYGYNWRPSCLFLPADFLLLFTMYLIAPGSGFVLPGWESSTTEMPWSNVITIMPGCVLRGASACRSSTLRLVWLRATATFGWRRDIEDQVRHKMSQR